jgi:hypothetical protein
MGEQARFACHLRRPVVSPYPSAQVSTFVPTRVIPEDDHHLFAFRSCHGQQANDKQPHLDAVGLSSAEIQQHHLSVVAHRAKTGQCLVGLPPFGFTLYQAQFLARCRPGMSLGLGKARKPAFIFPHQQPVWMLLCLLLQPVAPLFLTV